MKHYERRIALYALEIFACLLAVAIFYIFAPSLAALMNHPPTSSIRHEAIEDWRVFVLRYVCSGIFLIAGIRLFVLALGEIREKYREERRQKS